MFLDVGLNEVEDCLVLSLKDCCVVGWVSILEFFKFVFLSDRLEIIFLFFFRFFFDCISVLGIFRVIFLYIV